MSVKAENYVGMLMITKCRNMFLPVDFFGVIDVWTHSVDDSFEFGDFRISVITAAGWVELSVAVTLPLLFISTKKLQNFKTRV